MKREKIKKRGKHEIEMNGKETKENINIKVRLMSEEEKKIDNEEENEWKREEMKKKGKTWWELNEMKWKTEKENTNRTWKRD